MKLNEVMGMTIPARFYNILLCVDNERHLLSIKKEDRQKMRVFALWKDLSSLEKDQQLKKANDMCSGSLEIYRVSLEELIYGEMFFEFYQELYNKDPKNLMINIFGEELGNHLIRDKIMAPTLEDCVNTYGRLDPVNRLKLDRYIHDKYCSR